jgi:hypothetical protein
MAMTFGLHRFLGDIRYHRERFRQFLGISYIILVSLVGQPNRALFLTGTVFVGCGIAVRLWASGHVKKNEELATTGPYAYVRHPLYVGNLSILFGFALASGRWWAAVLVVPLMLAFYPPAIRSEDAKLQGKFGENWDRWREHARALVPRLTPYQSGHPRTWSLGHSLRENGEPVIALLLLSCLCVLFANVR